MGISEMNMNRQLTKMFLNTTLGINSLINKNVKNLKKIFSNDTIPYPRIIHIETRNRCNSTCSFCMANIKEDPRDDLLMPENLVEKIISELKFMDYSNRISYYNNNEPFLDKRIISFIEKTRINVPKAYLELKTNGRGLKIHKIIEIFNAGLDTMYINDYTDDISHSKNVLKIIDELKSIRRFKGHMKSRTGKYNNRIIINKRNLNEQLDTRAGTAPNAIKLKSSLNKPCFRPFEMMTINPEGIVGVCSEDFFYSTKMGNVNNQKLLDIWYSDKYKLFRSELIKGNRNVHDACSKCDYKGYNYEIFEELNNSNIKTVE